MRRFLSAAAAAFALLLLLLLALAGCGGTHVRLVAPVVCPQAAVGHGHPGACAPQKFGLPAPTVTVGPKYPDRSNNDPCYCGTLMRAQGYVGLIAKANQGTGFIDQTAVGMVQSARTAGLTVGLYDFDQDYTVAEARVFVARAHAAGIYPNTPNTFPLYFDVEFGNFSYPGLVAQIAYVRSQGYRVGIYTGAWYWTPHAGCRWPGGLSAWLSGYPSAPVPCGTTGYNAHQFTSTPVDLTVFLGSTSQFREFVHAVPAPKPTRAQIARWRGARDASRGAYAARRCDVFAQRERWFGARQHGRHAASHRRALRATRRAYAQRSCGVYAKRVTYFTHRLEGK